MSWMTDNLQRHTDTFMLITVHCPSQTNKETQAHETPHLLLIFPSHLVVLQEVAWLEGEKQRHVVVQRVFAVDVVGLVLQQATRLVHHPVRRVNGHLHLPLLVLDVHCDVQLGLLQVFDVVALVVVLSQGLEEDEADFVLVAAEAATTEGEKG